MRSKLWISIALSLLTLAVFWKVGSSDFIFYYDDKPYVTANLQVQKGLTVQGLVWAFASFHECNYHPLTWLSHMADCQFFGLNPMGHHLTNLFLHVANTVLLFLLFGRMTGMLWRSAFVAALFALHPLHVESVAWVAERKDVLSTFFWMLTLLGYARYAEQPGWRRYLLTLLSFALGLLAKSMLVTLPCVLLLLDFWPLCRMQAGSSLAGRVPALSAFKKMRILSALILEKLPFFALTAVACILTFKAQKESGAVQSLVLVPLVPRMKNAIVAYVSYLGDMFWPAGLAVIYPFPAFIPLWQVAAAGATLVAVTMLTLWWLRRYPFLAVGWFWYLGTLVPVIGLVQVGMQARADRYTYIPLIGIFLMVAWGVPELTRRWHMRRLYAIAGTAVVILLAVAAYRQVGYWQNDLTLFSHAVAVTTDNSPAMNNLGSVLSDLKRNREAAYWFKKSLEISPYQAFPYNNLGVLMDEEGRLDEALAYFSNALFAQRDYPQAHFNMGLVLEKKGMLKEAASHYRQVVQSEPDNVQALFKLGMVLAKDGKLDEAVVRFKEVLRVDPGQVRAHYNLGLALEMLGRRNEAIASYTEALRLRPDYREARENLANCRRLLGGR
jgi:tetratricopeptide (TPR) repeat protein